MSTSAVREHMKVVGCDLQPVGTVENVKDERIKLSRNDPQAGGVHHYISTTWVERVEGEQVYLRQSARYVCFQWMDA